MDLLDKTKKILNLQDKDIKALYLYGSRVYGTDSYNSDYDLLLVTDTLKSNTEYRNGLFNITTLSSQDFFNQLDEMKIKILECIFSPEKFKIKENIKYNFLLNREKLRTEISQKSSNSFVKAKKKIILEEEDSYKGIKSLFHSLRIIDFGNQIALYEKINDYSSSNWIWNELLNLENEINWNQLKEKWQPIKNQLLSEFRENNGYLKEMKR